ncbi:MAG: hypothetical protein WED05_00590 [Candidatus Atabeyarchaeum deiterrae]
MNERQPHHKIPISIIWRRLDNGESARKIAEKYHISHSNLRERLERLDKKRYKKIMIKRGAQHIVPISETWKKLEDGEPLGKIAQKYSIPPETLRRRLVKADRDRYMAIRRKRKLGTVPPEILFRKLAGGESVRKIAQEYCMYPEKLRRRLLQFEREIYEEIIDRTRAIKSEGYGSQEAKAEGADSDFELQVRKILDEHSIKFCSPTLKLGKRRYFPDFMTSDRTIVEAAGVTNREYWERYREKTKNYLKHGYPALIVVPYNLRKRAKDYLPHSYMIASVWISDFKKDPKKYLRILRSLRKVPIKERFPPEPRLALRVRTEVMATLCCSPPERSRAATDIG